MQSACYINDKSGKFKVNKSSIIHVHTNELGLLRVMAERPCAPPPPDPPLLQGSTAFSPPLISHTLPMQWETISLKWPCLCCCRKVQQRGRRGRVWNSGEWRSGEAEWQREREAISSISSCPNRLTRRVDVSGCSWSCLIVACVAAKLEPIRVMREEMNPGRRAWGS